METTTPTTRLVDLDAPPPGRQQPPATEATIWDTASRMIAHTASAWAGLAGYTHSLPDTWMSSGCSSINPSKPCRSYHYSCTKYGYRRRLVVLTVSFLVSAMNPSTALVTPDIPTTKMRRTVTAASIDPMCVVVVEYEISETTMNYIAS
jgi:hypothetical protein